ncbi:hypothetical protein HAX54_007812 [Datura stramonium]|uniref:Pseudouridine synthase RsuA/RluA-like domain-containing protein n=1 Tax=Datura stramonium TaxID=4076 RepID=A0ABS8RIN3_DATST|nr:hypothetical protein [Datura stramonium]
MASQSYFDSPTAATTDYPIPLSPPLPAISKDIEPNRALTASSKSALFSLSRSHVIFEDRWLIAVNKPQGIYCESVLSSLPDLLNDTGHGRSKYGAWRVYAASDAGRKLPGGSLVKDMETSFEVLSVNGLGCSKEVSDFQKDEAVVIVQEKSVIGCDLKKDEILVRASPRSGRTHQIRLHCQYLGIPIRGDVRYEGVYEWKGLEYDGHELHAKKKVWHDHPITGKSILLQAPPPSWAIQPLRSQFE